MDYSQKTLQLNPVGHYIHEPGCILDTVTYTYTSLDNTSIEGPFTIMM